MKRSPPAAIATLERLLSFPDLLEDAHEAPARSEMRALPPAFWSPPPSLPYTAVAATRVSGMPLSGNWRLNLPTVCSPRVVSADRWGHHLEELVQVCGSEGRWEFMVAASPLRLPGGTGTLSNPITIF